MHERQIIDVFYMNSSFQLRKARNPNLNVVQRLNRNTESGKLSKHQCHEHPSDAPPNSFGGSDACLEAQERKYDKQNI